MTRKKSKKTRQPSLSELAQSGWIAEYEQLEWQRAEVMDSDAAAKSVQLRMIVRGLYALVLTTIVVVWGPWTILYVWGASSSMRLWALPPPPVPTLQTIQTGLFVAGLAGVIYSLTRLSGLRRRIAPAARSADLAASAASDRANSASSA